MRVLARRRQLPEEVPEEFRTPTDPFGDVEQIQLQSPPRRIRYRAIRFPPQPPTPSERVHTSSPEESSDATEHPCR